MRNKLIGLVAVVAMLLIAVPAAFAGGSQEATTSDGRQIVTFWYNNTGDEALVYEQVIADYNASQDKYTVQGLSVTDAQKLIVAMSSNAKVKITFFLFMLCCCGFWFMIVSLQVLVCTYAKIRIFFDCSLKDAFLYRKKPSFMCQKTAFEALKDGFLQTC